MQTGELRVLKVLQVILICNQVFENHNFRQTSGGGGGIGLGDGYWIINHHNH